MCNTILTNLIRRFLHVGQRTDLLFALFTIESVWLKDFDLTLNVSANREAFFVRQTHSHDRRINTVGDQHTFVFYKLGLGWRFGKVHGFLDAFHHTAGGVHYRYFKMVRARHQVYTTPLADHQVTGFTAGVTVKVQSTHWLAV